MTTKHLAIAAMMVTLLGCSNSYEDAETESTLEEAQVLEEPQPFSSSYSPSSSYDEGSSSEEEDTSEESEDQVRYESASFMGYPCTVDCSGHEAGYQWAEDNGIDDPSDCGGNSNSFIEGCEAYAEEQSVEE